jgi:hypothetical protein
VYAVGEEFDPARELVRVVIRVVHETGSGDSLPAIIEGFTYSQPAFFIPLSTMASTWGSWEVAASPRRSQCARADVQGGPGFWRVSSAFRRASST